MPWCVPVCVQILWDSLGFLNFLEVYFLRQKLGKFSFIIFSNKFSTHCSCSSPSGTPDSDIRSLKVVPEFPKPLLIFFFFLNSCFFILFWLDGYFFLLCQIVYLSPSFLPFTVSLLFILLYFTLGSLHFFLHFATKLSQFCKHSDYQCFELCFEHLHQMGCLSLCRLALFLEF